MRALPLALALAAAWPAMAEIRQTSLGPVEITREIDGLEGPWSLAFLPSGAMLVTEKAGRLWHVTADGERSSIHGLPEVADIGQGGLLDVLVPRDFADSREVYLSFARPQGRGAGTALAVGRLPEGDMRLQDVRVIFELAEGSRGGRHFGSRIVEGADGFLHLTIGDRGDRPSAQDLARENGSVVRVARDGTVPADNPFTDMAGAASAIWSYGHRNPQGAALDAEGRLWTVEHGARGGDEINLIERGANYGWPVISYGRHYSGARIGEGTEKPGLEQPVFYWDPSIAPSGMTFVSGELFPEWEGDILVGSLKFDLISRLETDGGVSEVERIQTPETQRVRDVRLGPDGAIWFISEGNGAVYRMAPAPGG